MKQAQQSRSLGWSEGQLTVVVGHEFRGLKNGGEAAKSRAADDRTEPRLKQGSRQGWMKVKLWQLLGHLRAVLEAREQPRELPKRRKRKKRREERGGLELEAAGRGGHGGWRQDTAWPKEKEERGRKEKINGKRNRKKRKNRKNRKMRK